MESLVVVWDQDTDKEDGENEKGEDAPESLANGLRHGNTGVCGLSSTDSTELSTLVRETGLDENGPETDKLGNRSFGQVRGESTGGVPVLEADIALRTNTCVHADGVDPEADKGDDLDQREPEFEFSEDIDRQKVNSRDRYPEDSDEDADAEVRVPPLNDKTGGCEFERICDRPGEPVNPSHGET